MKSTFTTVLTIIVFLLSSLTNKSMAQNSPQKLTLSGVLHLIITQNGNQMTINSVSEGSDDNSFKVTNQGNNLKVEMQPVGGIKNFVFNINNLTEIKVDGVTHVNFQNILKFDDVKFDIEGVIEGPINVTCNKVFFDIGGVIENAMIVKCTQANFNIDGVVKAPININAEQLDLKTKGVSELFLEGKADFMTLLTDGVGTICAKDLITQQANIEADGVNNVWVNVMQHLQVKIDGVSNVYFKNYNWSDVLEQRLPRLYSQISGISHVKMWRENGKNECNDKGSLMNTEIKKVEDPKKAPETPKSKGVIKKVDIKIPLPDIKIGKKDDEELPEPKPVPLPKQDPPKSKGKVTTIGKKGTDVQTPETDIKVGSDVEIKVDKKNDEDLPEPGPVALPKQDSPKSKGKVTTVGNGGTNVNAGDTDVNVGTGSGTDVQNSGTGVNVNQTGTTINTSGTNANVGTGGTKVETKSSNKRKSKARRIR
jgi:hypothetical protein